MNSLSISEIEILTGVKAHVLRYWEEHVPLFSPKKDLSGRRFYTQNDLELIFRLKFLINEKKFTVEGAGKELLNEAQNSQKDFSTLQLIKETRKQLSDAFLLLQKHKTQ